MFFIAGNTGEIYAHDIDSKIRARLTLADIIATIGADKAEELELEIIEQED